MLLNAVLNAQSFPQPFSYENRSFIRLRVSISQDKVFYILLRFPVKTDECMLWDKEQQTIDSKKKKNFVVCIHDALIKGIGVPKDELFNMVSEYEPGNFFYSRSFNSISRSDDLIVVEITMRRGRSDATKRALYAGITDNLQERAGVSPRDVLFLCMKMIIRTGPSATENSRWQLNNKGAWLDSRQGLRICHPI